MSDIRDFFIKTLDDSSTGIQAMMDRLRTRISEVDPEVEKQLDRQGIKMQYFAFRLVLILKSQPPDLLPQVAQSDVVTRVLSAGCADPVGRSAH